MNVLMEMVAVVRECINTQGSIFAAVMDLHSLLTEEDALTMMVFF